MITLLLAAAATVTALDAERAFARDAQRIGQWAAFRRWADDDAVMFTPQANWARDFLRDRPEPARAVRWWASDSFTSCDGKVAANLGSWRGGDGKTGRFTTVWLSKSQGWRWIYDGGEPGSKVAPAPARPRVHRASCAGAPTGAPIMAAATTPPQTPRKSPDDVGRGESGDRTLGWDWKVGAKGERRFRLFRWTGRAYELAIDQHVAP